MFSLFPDLLIHVYYLYIDIYFTCIYSQLEDQHAFYFTALLHDHCFGILFKNTQIISVYSYNIHASLEMP